LPRRDIQGIPYPTDLPTALEAIRALTEALRLLQDRIVTLEKRV
jgi:hypothetical protein